MLVMPVASRAWLCTNIAASAGTSVVGGAGQSRGSPLAILLLLGCVLSSAPPLSLQYALRVLVLSARSSLVLRPKSSTTQLVDRALGPMSWVTAPKRGSYWRVSLCINALVAVVAKMPTAALTLG